jgi:hypothetical protein
MTSVYEQRTNIKQSLCLTFAAAPARGDGSFASATRGVAALASEAPPPVDSDKPPSLEAASAASLELFSAAFSDAFSVCKISNKITYD